MGLSALVQGLTLGFSYAIVALGFSLVVQTTGVLNFAQGCYVMLGGLGAAWAVQSLHLPLALALLIGLAMATAAGAIEALGVLLPLWRRGAPTYVTILGTALVLIALQNLALYLFGSQPLQLPPLVHGHVRVASTFVSDQSLLLVGVTIVLIAALLAFLRWSKYGMAMRACANDRETARLLGIPPARIAFLVMCVTALLGGLAGVLIAPIQFASYTVAQTYTTYGFIAAMVGGLGDMRGAMVGGLAVGLAQTYIGTYLASEYTDVLLVGFVILLILFRPQGLLTRQATPI